VLQKIRTLFANVVIYGVGDAATQVISFLLLPIYVRYLSPDDYGVLSLLLTAEVVTKILFRWGIDASFMRLYYDCRTPEDRQRLASTQLIFLVAVNGVLLLAGFAAAPAIGHHLFHTSQYTLPLRLVFANTFVVGLYFVPFHVMRIEGRPRQFIAFSFARSLATLVMRLALVIGVNLGVLGVVLADVAVTVVFTVVLARWCAHLLRPVFSRRLLRESLRFGLPRVPHGVAHQVIAVSDRYILARFVTLHELGLYSIGASFGLAMKLFLSAFEYAWAPFYFGTMGEPNAKQLFSRVTTYGVALLSLLVAGLAAISGDLVAAMTRPEFHYAARVVPWIGLGAALQGVYLLTSIGLNITKRTEYYPMATAIAAGTSVAANLVLIPRFGIVGSAVANTLAYGVLAFVSWHFSQKLYPMRYERGRLLRAMASAAVAYGVARMLPLGSFHALVGLLARGATVVAVFGAMLVITRFFVAGERAHVAELTARLRRRRTAASASEITEMAGEVVSTPLNDDAEDAGAVDDGDDAASKAEVKT
jgi:O-antigen/teichoic acid export membrane protein